VAFKAVRDVLVLDEIFAVGDAGFKARCERRYRELRSLGHSAIIVSHDPRIVATFCDRAVLIDGAHIIADGPARDVADRYVASLPQQCWRPPPLASGTRTTKSPAAFAAGSRVPRPVLRSPIACS